MSACMESAPSVTHEVYHVTDRYPTSLMTAKQVIKAIGAEITSERLLELAESGYVPHYRVDGGAPRFRRGEVKRWLGDNLVRQCYGRDIPEINVIQVTSASDLPSRPPSALCALDCLIECRKTPETPGIYFLCKGDEVVYVGQSVCPALRIGQHSSEGIKDFDRSYVLLCPRSALNEVEAAFIQTLTPRYNGVRPDGSPVGARRGASLDSARAVVSKVEEGTAWPSSRNARECA